MTDHQIAALIHNLRRFEGMIPFMYLDNATIPNVTVGIGVMLPSATDAVALPFVNLSAQRPATDAEITQTFNRVRMMRGGMGAGYYKGVTDIELPEGEITALAVSRLRGTFLPKLAQQFRAWDALPFPAQEVLVDMEWNLGVGGLAKFHNLAAAVDRRDWERAALESHVSTSRPARNEWRAATFRQCATGSVAA